MSLTIPPRTIAAAATAVARAVARADSSAVFSTSSGCWGGRGWDADTAAHTAGGNTLAKERGGGRVVRRAGEQPRQPAVARGVVVLVVLAGAAAAAAAVPVHAGGPGYDGDWALGCVQEGTRRSRLR